MCLPKALLASPYVYPSSCPLQTTTIDLGRTLRYCTPGPKVPPTVTSPPQSPHPGFCHVAQVQQQVNLLDGLREPVGRYGKAARKYADAIKNMREAHDMFTASLSQLIATTTPDDIFGTGGVYGAVGREVWV